MSSASSRLTEYTRRPTPLVIAVLILILIFAGIYAWRGYRLSAGSVAYAPPPVEVSTVTAQAEALPQTLNATGSLQAVREVLLASEAPGRVDAISFDAGQNVGQGSVLVRLFDGQERADRAAAVSRLKFAQIQYDRSKTLAQTGAEPEQLLQQREAELSQARAAIQQIDARITQKTVRAPFSGQIGLRRVNLGQYLNPGDPVATLTALDRLYVNFSVPQQLLTKLRVGGTVTVRSDAMPDREFSARINAVEPVVGNDTRNISVQAVMPNAGGVLRSGLYVTVDVAQSPRDGAILVPATAIQTSASGESVFLVKGGKAALVPVTVGSEYGERTLVESGIRAGDVVVTTGQLRLQPGAAVKVVAPAAPKPAR